jgi:hypothetical protein
MNSNYQNVNTIMQNLRNLENLENFELSGSESDTDSESHIINNNISVSDLVSDIQLQNFPEPYNYLGQFIISSIIGVLITSIFKNRIKQKDQTYQLDQTSLSDYYDYLDIYYKYCNNVSSDSYIIELALNLKLDLSNDIDKVKFNSILTKLNFYSKEILNLLLESNIELINKYILINNNEFNIEIVELELTQYLIPLIKFNKLTNILLL